MRFRKKLEQAGLDILGRPLMSLWMRSLRRRVVGREAYDELRRAGKPVVILVWHGKIFSAPWTFRRRGVMPLVSPSQDGELMVRLIDHWGYRIIRGSGSHFMRRAWMAMLRELRSGGEVLIVPDGPRGPDRELKLGAVRLAAETGALLVPYTLAAARKRVLSSWDRFEMPRFFSRAVALFGEPTTIPPGLGADELERERDRVEETLRRLDERAENLLAKPKR
jgi:lysophospholipid acyltransferase (LPLAT)-like uncharacterized protein